MSNAAQPIEQLIERVTAGSRLIAPGIEAVEGVFPKGIFAVQTSRQGGVSKPPYGSFNLGGHVGDDPHAVAENRQRLKKCCAAIPVWLEQVHGTRVADLDELPAAAGGETHAQADASITASSERACAVLTADCLPILAARERFPACAAIHAGWRGLLAGVIEETLSAMFAGSPEPDRWSFWLGPCIGPEAFEVGEEVRQAFIDESCASDCAFRPKAEQGKYLADLRLLAEQRIARWFADRSSAVLTHESESSDRDVISRSVSRPIRLAKSNACTFFDQDRYFSFRRDRKTGRMASLIGLESI